MTNKLTAAILRRAAAVRDAQGYGALIEFARAMGVSYQGLCRRLKEERAEGEDVCHANR